LPKCSAADRKALEQLANSRTEQARIVERARIILGCVEGRPVTEIATELGVRPNTVIFWRKRFQEKGLKGLNDRPRSGKPRHYDENFRRQVLAALEEKRWMKARSSAILSSRRFFSSRACLRANWLEWYQKS